MPALQLTGFGEPAEVVTLVSQPPLVVGRDEVVVALEAATVHPSDIHLIRGFWRSTAPSFTCTTEPTGGSQSIESSRRPNGRPGRTPPAAVPPSS